MTRRINTVRGALNRDLQRRRRAGAPMSCNALADYLEAEVVAAWENYAGSYGDPLGPWVGDGYSKAAERRFWLMCEPIIASLLMQLESGWEVDVVVNDQNHPTSVLLIRTTGGEMDVRKVPITWEPRLVRFGGRAHALASKRAGAAIIRTFATIVAAFFGAPTPS